MLQNSIRRQETRTISWEEPKQLRKKHAIRSFEHHVSIAMVARELGVLLEMTDLGINGVYNTKVDFKYIVCVCVCVCKTIVHRNKL
jgi:hypothetical protein